jgi:hypothetical protein
MNKPFVEDKVRLHTVLPNASKLAYSYNRKNKAIFSAQYGVNNRKGL